MRKKKGKASVKKIKRINRMERLFREIQKESAKKMEIELRAEKEWPEGIRFHAPY